MLKPALVPPPKMLRSLLLIVRRLDANSNVGHLRAQSPGCWHPQPPNDPF
jgi:hypothetical protein